MAQSGIRSTPLSPAMPGRQESVPHILERLGIRASALVSDSRRAGPGTVFAAYPGETRDGRDFIAQAVAQRVDGVLWEADHYQWDPALGVPNAGVPGLKSRIGEIAAQVYGEPSRALHMIGITGTNGKTSVAHWLAQAFTVLGRKTAVVGTVGNGFPAALTPAVKPIKRTPRQPQQGQGHKGQQKDQEPACQQPRPPPNQAALGLGVRCCVSRFTAMMPNFGL